MIATRLYKTTGKHHQTILQVYESSDHGIFRVDDVFVTGMLAEKANVSHRDISDLITFYEDWDEEVSIERKGRCLLNHIFKWLLSQTVGYFRSRPMELVCALH